jgi:hypothetical protein
MWRPVNGTGLMVMSQIRAARLRAVVPASRPVSVGMVRDALAARPVIVCGRGGCTAPVRYATLRERAAYSRGVPYPDVSADCLWHSVEACWRFLGVPVRRR